MMKTDDATIAEAHQMNSGTLDSESCNEIHPDALALAQLIYDIYKERQDQDSSNQLR
jgi:hypothetical protein